LPDALKISWPWAEKAPSAEEIPRGVPHVETGRVELPQKGWTRVNFKTPFIGTPVVTPVAEYRESWYEQPRYVAKQTRVRIPGVNVVYSAVDTARTRFTDLGPGIDFSRAPLRDWEIPRVQRPDMRDQLGREAEYKAESSAKAIMGDWNVKIGPYSVGLNWIRDRVARGYGLVGYAAGWWAGAYLNWIWDALVQPQVDSIRDHVNFVVKHAVGDVNNSIASLSDRTRQATDRLRDSANAGLAELRDSTNSALERLKNTTNEGLGTLAGTTNQAFNVLGVSTENGINEQAQHVASEIERSVNDTLETRMVQQWLGMVPGQTITPVLYRKVDNKGFDVYSVGDMVLHYIAIEMPGQMATVALPSKELPVEMPEFKYE
jgi:hypothetical protein